MKVDLAALTTFPSEVHLAERADAIKFTIEGVRFGDGVNAVLTIQKADDEYFVYGSCAARVEMECARCLEPANVELTGDLEIIAHLGDAHASGRNRQIDVDEQSVTLPHTEELELDEFIRQALASEVPLKPLCDEDCAGLCPTCGANRNNTPCKCDTSPSDSRWEKLAKLK